MTTSALIIFSLVSSNNMSNMFVLNYLKTQEKDKLLQLKNRQYEYRRNQLTSKRALMFAKHNKNNYNINKEHKR
jgi:hypothetical protein